MKKLLFPLLLLSYYLQAQDPCLGDTKGFIFQANQIGALYSPRGIKHFDFYDGYFKVPYQSEKSPSTIFAAGPWIGGFVGNELRLSGQTYASSTNRDLYVGPLSPGAIPYNLCDAFNHVWAVDRNEIIQHIEDFTIDGIVNDTLASIFGWPAQGNIYFEQFNGFQLPSDHVGGWASFVDLNQNGIYEPDLGEYPDVLLKGKSVIPEEIAWMVFNDQGPHLHSHAIPLGVEMQLTVFGFSCEDNPVLNQTVFNTYKIINQGNERIDSTYFGIWSDYDLGCASDDYLGCDSTRNSEFVYNDEVDGSVGIECTSGQATYGVHPPVQSMTYLSPPMNSFTIEQYQDIGNPIWPSYQNASEQYRLLAGTWPDGTPIRKGGIGYQVSSDYPITKYLFDGDPRDSTQWTWWNDGPKGTDPRSISSTYLSSIPSGDFKTVETAYTFHLDTTLDHLGQLGPMYENLDSLLAYVDDIGSHCQATEICDTKDCVWPGDFNHNGIADHYDLLYWGVMKDSTGAKRDGRINWQGHFANPWSLTLPDNLNSKHGDGNGDGRIDFVDLERNENHFLLTNPYYIKNDQYPIGPELTITANPEFNTDGRIRNVYVLANQDMLNVTGLAFEFEYDTSLFRISGIYLSSFPADSSVVEFSKGKYITNAGNILESRYAFVKSDHTVSPIQQGFVFQRYISLALKAGLDLSDLPDSSILRLKNLIALDVNGNDLHIGCSPFTVYKSVSTSTDNINVENTFVYPNPTNQVLYVNTTTAQHASIISTLGIVVKEISADQLLQPIDLSSVNPGIYFLKLEKSGTTLRFIKQ